MKSTVIETCEVMKYFYNGVGALVCDANKGIAHIEYDNLNHPREIQFTNGGIIRYVYAADGTKLRTSYITPVENIVVPINSTLPLQPSQIISEDSVEYLGEEIYANGELEKFLFTDGYVSMDTQEPKFHYFTKDHLGNVRTVTDEQGTLEQVSHYYPFGGIYGDAGFNQTLQPYTFGGKELDRMHGLNWYDFGARMYDPALCTWTSFDALGEKYYGDSPFIICGGDPINMVDYDGMDYWYTNNPNQIKAFINAYRNGDKINFSKWQHLSDSDFNSSLFYNDRTNTYWLNYSAILNGEFTKIAMNLGAKRSWRWNPSLDDAFNAVDGFSNGCKDVSPTSRVGSNGKMYFKERGEQAFYGNQYVKTYSVNKIGESLKKVNYVSRFLAGCDIYKSIQKDGGKIGKETQKTATRLALGYMFSSVGSFGGSAIGSAICPGVGTVIGETIGSVGGGIVADYVYDRFIDL